MKKKLNRVNIVILSVICTWSITLSYLWFPEIEILNVILWGVICAFVYIGFYNLLVYVTENCLPTTND